MDEKPGVFQSWAKAIFAIVIVLVLFACGVAALILLLSEAF